MGKKKEEISISPQWANCVEHLPHLILIANQTAIQKKLNSKRTTNFDTEPCHPIQRRMQPKKVLPIYLIHHLMAIFHHFHHFHHFDKMTVLCLCTPFFPFPSSFSLSLSFLCCFYLFICFSRDSMCYSWKAELLSWFPLTHSIIVQWIFGVVFVVVTESASGCVATNGCGKCCFWVMESGGYSEVFWGLGFG